MAKRSKTPKTPVPSELSIQKWLASVIQDGRLDAVITGEEALTQALEHSTSATFFPSFPIDYLARLRWLEAAKRVVSSLHDLVPITDSLKSVSRTKHERFFIDLLYAAGTGARFVAFELKRDQGTARETVTELMAYEQEILNHIPFASSDDVYLVVVAAEYTPLLEHAVSNLICWKRRQILCLRYEHSSPEGTLAIHLPRTWAAVGQGYLPSSGLQVGHLCLNPDPGLTSDQIRRVFDTAAQLLVREAERLGGSGFVMLTENILFPHLALSPFQLVVGALNPYSLLPDAERKGLASSSDSPLTAYLLDATNQEVLTTSWNWTANGGSAAHTYLRQFGHATWEGFTDWDHFRDVRRWRATFVSADRHLVPLMVDFWGAMGDYARDVVIHQKRLKAFMPGMAKPGLDWRYPHFGVMLLDDIGIRPLADGGQWTFEDVFALGMRLGRWTTIASEFASADSGKRRKLSASLFWSEADVVRILNEVSWRYLAATDLKIDPPPLGFGVYDDSANVHARASAFAEWISAEFIGPRNPLLQEAFDVGLRSFVLYDVMFAPKKSDPQVAIVRSEIVDTARRWLSLAVRAYCDDRLVERDHARMQALVAEHFGNSLPLNEGVKAAMSAIARLAPEVVVEAMFQTIPQIVGCWAPQLAHTLASTDDIDIDWEWYEQEIKSHRARGVKYPCVYRTPNGELSIGQLPQDMKGIPSINDPATEVLFADNQTGFELIIRTTWASLRSGAALRMGVQDDST